MSKFRQELAEKLRPELGGHISTALWSWLEDWMNRAGVAADVVVVRERAGVARALEALVIDVADVDRALREGGRPQGPALDSGGRANPGDRRGGAADPRTRGEKAGQAGCPAHAAPLGMFSTALAAPALRPQPTPLFLVRGKGSALLPVDPVDGRATAAAGM